ncbi:hypothetical protein ACV35H_34640, partial [Pseudomonas aeruginosa]
MALVVNAYILKRAITVLVARWLIELLGLNPAFRFEASKTPTPRTSRGVGFFWRQCVFTRSVRRGFFLP